MNLEDEAKRKKRLMIYNQMTKSSRNQKQKKLKIKKQNPKFSPTEKKGFMYKSYLEDLQSRSSPNTIDKKVKF